SRSGSLRLALRSRRRRGRGGGALGREHETDLAASDAAPERSHAEHRIIESLDAEVAFAQKQLHLVPDLRQRPLLEDAVIRVVLQAHAQHAGALAALEHLADLLLAE